MLTFVTFVLSFVASTLAYTVLTPNNSTGWTNTGGQLITWQRVNTDPTNFSISLVNQQLPGFVEMQLAALVQGGDSSGNTTVNAPAGGWVPAPNYRVNFVKIDDNNTIYAQSDFFTINGSSTTSSTSGTTITSPSASANNGATGTSGSSASDTASILPTSSSAAALSYTVQTGLLGLFSILGFALA